MFDLSGPKAMPLHFDNPSPHDKEFTNLNLIAMDQIRVEAWDKEENPCCWLVMSPEAKRAARVKAVEFIKPLIGSFTLDERHNPDRYIDKALRGQFDAKIRLWRQAELEREKERQAGNPKAYFVN